MPQENDIYGFEIIAYEICTAIMIRTHDEFLVIKICWGLVRVASNYEYLNLIGLHIFSEYK